MSIEKRANKFGKKIVLKKLIRRCPACGYGLQIYYNKIGQPRFVGCNGYWSASHCNYKE